MILQKERLEDAMHLVFGGMSFDEEERAKALVLRVFDTYQMIDKWEKSLLEQYGCPDLDSDVA
jgi:hypothetical protein